jgi:hypothetical protein
MKSVRTSGRCKTLKPNFRSKRGSGCDPEGYALAIEALGLSQRDAGVFLGVNERTSRRWVLGESTIPESAAKLLRLMVRLKLSPEDVT